MPLGISFIPQRPQQQQPGGNQHEPLQQALQMLSLRMPRVTGAGAIAPDLLLQRQPGSPLAPMPGTPEWEALMKRLQGGFLGQPPSQPVWKQVPPLQPSEPPPSLPPPHVTPITPSEPFGPGGPPPLPDKPLPDDRMQFSGMFNRSGAGRPY